MQSFYAAMLASVAVVIVIRAPGLWRLVALLPAVAAFWVMLLAVKTARQYAFGDDVPPLATRLLVLARLVFSTRKSRQRAANSPDNT